MKKKSVFISCIMLCILLTITSAVVNGGEAEGKSGVSISSLSTTIRDIIEKTKNNQSFKDSFTSITNKLDNIFKEKSTVPNVSLTDKLKELQDKFKAPQNTGVSLKDIFNNSSLNDNSNDVVRDKTSAPSKDTFQPKSNDCFKGKKEIPEYIYGELLIKFKGNVSQKLKAAQSANALLQRVSLSGSLDKLNKKYKLKEITALFKDFSNGYVTELKNKFPLRSRRETFPTKAPDLSNIYLVELEDKEADIEKVCREYQNDPGVEYAEPNRYYQVNILPNDKYIDPLVQGQWSDGSWEQPYEDMWGLKAIEAEQAWEIEKGSSAIKIAVIDTGVDYNHEDLRGKMVSPYDFVNLNPGEASMLFGTIGYEPDPNDDYYQYDNDPLDRHGHGTHIAGTISANTGNGIGIAGVTWNCKIMPIRVGFSLKHPALEKSDTFLFNNAIAKGIEYAAKQGADIINMSFGGGYSNTIHDAIRFAYSQGCILVAAAGNANMDASLFFPANCPEVIAVSAHDENLRKSDFSNWGVKIDVAAPGGGSRSSDGNNALGRNILSLRAKDTDMYEDETSVVDTQYYRARGTSMAAPHVCGVCGLILSQNPSLTVEEVRMILRKSADDIVYPLEDSYEQKTGWDASTGYGKINARKALETGPVCVAKLTSPQINQKVQGELEIKGIAKGKHFKSYALEFGPGLEPQSWDTITSGITTPAETAQVLGHLDTTLANEGMFTIRLTVLDENNERVEDRIALYADNISINAPGEGELLANDIIEIYGRTGGSEENTFLRYTLEYRFSEEEQWKTQGIELLNKGEEEVPNGLLGKWNTTGLSWDKDRDVELRLKVFCSRQDLEDKITLYQSKGMHRGWPKVINNTNSLRSPNIADLNGDQYKEIVCGQYDSLLPGSDSFSDGGKVYVWQHTGQNFAGNAWPKEADYPSRALLGDLNQDGQLEIAFTSLCAPDVENTAVFVYENNGNLHTGWPVQSKDKSFTEDMALADVTGNPQMEVISAIYRSLYDHGIAIHDQNGGLRNEWILSRREDHSFGTSEVLDIAVGNVDGDGAEEIVVTDPLLLTEKAVYIFRADGTLLNGWDHGEEERIRTLPTLADLDQDNQLEIIYATSVDKEINFFRTECRITIYAKNPDGTDLPGWPKQFLSLYENLYYLEPVAGDIDGDGQPEIAMMLNLLDMDTELRHCQVHLWHSDGKEVAGFPYTLQPLNPANPPDLILGTNEIRMADVDNDNKVDLLFSTEEIGYSPWRKEFSVWAVDNQGRLLENWPRTMSPQGTQTFSLAISDIDNDEKIELVGTGWYRTNKEDVSEASFAMVWDIDSAAHPYTIQWPMFRHNPQGTGCYTTIAPPPSIDTTPPTKPVVTGKAKYKTGQILLSATWLSSDPESGIAEYQYSIGTTKGGTDIVKWTSAGLNTSVTKTISTSYAGKKYYFSVKAKNSAEKWSDIGISAAIKAKF